jgi:hypothetical protein
MPKGEFLLRFSVGSTSRLEQNPCVKLTMTTTSAGTITSLEALSWPIGASPPHVPWGNPRSNLQIRRQRCYCVVPLLEVFLCNPRCASWSRCWLPLRAWASKVRTSLIALLGRRLLWFGSVTLFSRRLLGLWADSALACAFLEVDLVSRRSLFFIVTRPISLVYRLLAILGKR